MSNSQNNPKSVELEIMNFLSSFMKEKVGRGPRDIKIKIIEDTLVFFVIGILSPLEKNILLSPEGEKVILEGRKLYLEMTNEERLAKFEKIVGAKVVDHYEAWNLKKDTSAAVFVFDQNIV